MWVEFPKEEKPKQERSSILAARLHNDLREVWAIVSKYPGITYSELSQKAGFSKSKAHKLVGLLRKSGTLVVAENAGKHKSRTLTATVPLITVRSKT